MKRLCLRTVRPAWNVNLCKAGCFRPRVDNTRYRRPSEARTFYFAHPFDFARHGNDFDRVLREQRVIVAEMLPSDRLVDVRALSEERESVDQGRIRCRSDILRGIEDRDHQAFRVVGPLSCDALRYDRPSHAPRETISEVHLTRFVTENAGD